MVDNNDSLLREVEEELRRERLAKLWEKYGFYVVGLVALLVAGVGGYQLWKSRQIALANEGGSLYESAMKLTGEGKLDEAQRAYSALTDGGHRAYAALGALQLAGADLKAGKRDDALVKFDAIAKDSTADPLLKNFATLQAASLRLGQADLPEMQNRLNDLAADGNPWRFHARELLGLAAYKAGDTQAAMQQFDRILGDKGSEDEVSKQLGVAADLGPPQGVAQRVRILMGSLMTEMMAKAASTAPPATPAATDGKSPEAKGAGDKAGAAPASGSAKPAGAGE
jgi:hypothetical protein